MIADAYISAVVKTLHRWIISRKKIAEEEKTTEKEVVEEEKVTEKEVIEEIKETAVVEPATEALPEEPEVLPVEQKSEEDNVQNVTTTE